MNGDTETKILQLLGVISVEVGATRNDLCGLGGEVTGLRGQVTGLRGEVTGLRSEMRAVDSIALIGALDILRRALNIWKSMSAT